MFIICRAGAEIRHARVGMLELFDTHASLLFAFCFLKKIHSVLLDALAAHPRRSWQTLLELRLRTIPAAICFWQSYAHGAGS